MEIRELFVNLFEYNREMNRRVIQFISGESATEDVRLISHILNAQAIWNSRILGVSAAYRVWDVHPAAELDRIDTLNHKVSDRILKTIPFESHISYANSKGEKFSNTVTEILFHIINHSTHHRSQLITAWRKNGADVAPSDFIFYQRSRNA